MPVNKCTCDGVSGYRWGSEGKCYSGPDAKKKAIKQGVAIEGPAKFSQKATEQNIFLNADDISAVADWMCDEGYDTVSVVATTSLLLALADKIAGYPPSCNEGYVAKDGKCVPSDDGEAAEKEWDKIDKKELKRDTKKEKKEHEKDAIKDDKEKVKKLKKGDPSEKKKREVKDLKKDERYDKRDAKSASDKEEYRQDKWEMKHDTLHEKLQHHKDAVKNLEREIKDLKKDKREDEKDVRVE